MVSQTIELNRSLEEAQVIVAMLRLGQIWDQLLAEEQARMLQLLIEHVVVSDRLAELRLQPLVLASLTPKLLAGDKAYAP